jgi:uncharacterized protein (TIGR00369 family)
MTDGITLNKEELQARLLKAPFHQWLGLSVEDVTPDEITVRARWREEFVVNAEGGYTHGGILATLIDVVADYALAARLGRPFPTVDLRVDYHRPAMRGDLICKAKILRVGGQVSSAEASIFDSGGRLLASGRGVYLTADAAR